MRKRGSEHESSEQRWRLLHRLEDWLEAPMVVLGLVWLVLLVVELAWGIGPLLGALANAIWILFVGDFLLRLALAPRKLAYVRGNWLTAVSLALPALRVLRAARAFRAVRALRATRGIRLVRIVTSLNRGMRALGRSMERRGFGYVAAMTALVTAAGAAGMYAFEREAGGEGIESYGEALWWTAMLLTTIGSEYWPQTAEGRLLTLLLSAYGLGILGYITALLASFFIGRDAARPEGEIAGENSIESLRREVARLREDLALARSDAAGDVAKPDRPIRGGSQGPGS